jgi:hypothetical protein
MKPDHCRDEAGRAHRLFHSDRQMSKMPVIPPMFKVDSMKRGVLASIRPNQSPSLVKSVDLDSQPSNDKIMLDAIVH